MPESDEATGGELALGFVSADEPEDVELLDDPPCCTHGVWASIAIQV